VAASAGNSAECVSRILEPHIVRGIAGFQLRIVGQTVVLNGTAPSFYSKQLVQHAVMVATELQIVNRINVANRT
jgi:hypothetical protein